MQEIGLLDNPPTFDLSGRIDPGAIVAASRWFGENVDPGIRMSVANYYRDCLAWARSGQRVEIYRYRRWQELPALIERIPQFVIPGSVVASVSDVSDDDRSPYCEVHGLYFDRRYPCPVCDNSVLHHGSISLRERLPR